MRKSHEREWDKIDEIVDQNGGHYVVPTIPGKVDTSVVSRFIQKEKAKRTMDEK
jgi:hypothetical protein